MSDHTVPVPIAEALWAIRPELAPTITAALRVDADLPARQGDDSAPDKAFAIRRSTKSGGGGVAVIPLSGLITRRPSLLGALFGVPATLPRLQASLRQALADPDVGAIVLEVDSPGGTVDGVPEMAAEIRAARASKPIVAVANAQAASAAYWLASQANEVFVTPSGEVGSIGVLAMHTDWSQHDEKAGVKTTLISAGKFKTEANPYEPLSDEARAAIQADVDAYYDMFVADVAEGRGVPPSRVRSGFGEGRTVLAKAAVAEGMADRVGTVDDAVRRAARLASGAASPIRAEHQGAHVHAAPFAFATSTNPEPDVDDAAPEAPDPEKVLSAHWARELLREQLADA